jgi:hypothetical protein
VVAELGEVEGGRGRHRLVSRHVAGETTARIGVLPAARTERLWRRTSRHAGSAKASSACSLRLSRGTIQQMRSTIPASIRGAAASTGKDGFAAPRRHRGKDAASI